MRHHKSRLHHHRRRRTSKAIWSRANTRTFTRTGTMMSRMRTRTGTTSVRFSRRGTTATVDSVYALSEATGEREHENGGEQQRSANELAGNAVQQTENAQTQSQTAAVTNASGVDSPTKALTSALARVEDANGNGNGEGGGEEPVDAVEYMDNVRELKAIKFKQVVNSAFTAYKLQKKPYQFERYEVRRTVAGGAAAARKPKLVPVLRGYTPFDSTPPSNKKIYKLERLKRKAHGQYLESLVHCSNFTV